MGSISARKFRDVVVNVRRALAIELMTAAAGVDQRSPLRPSRGVEATLTSIREVVPKMLADRPLYRDIAAIERLLRVGAVRSATEAAVGPLA